MTNTLEVKVTKIIPAPRKVVFDAWLDAKALARFMTPGEGVTVPKAEADAKVGGKFLIVMLAGDKELPHHGEYKTIDEHDRIVFSWLSQMCSSDSIVTLDFKEISDNATELTLHHVGFPHEESRSNHEGGWKTIVGKLANVVA